MVRLGGLKGTIKGAEGTGGSEKRKQTKSRFTRGRGNNNKNRKGKRKSVVGIRSIHVASGNHRKDEEDDSLISELTSPISPSSWNQSPTTTDMQRALQEEDSSTNMSESPADALEQKSSLVSSMLHSMVDMSCVTSSGFVEKGRGKEATDRGVESSLTFPPPEWGVPPQEEEDGILTTTARTKIVRGSPQRRHETFELVYQEPSVAEPKRGMAKKALGLFRPNKAAATAAPSLGIKPRSDIPEPSLLREPAAATVSSEPRNNPAARVFQRVFPSRSSNTTSSPIANKSSSDTNSEESSILQQQNQQQHWSGSIGAADTELSSNSGVGVHRKVLESIKGGAKLETVEEESFTSDSVTSFKVRVPGEPNKFITDKDLIGDEVVEEIYSGLEKNQVAQDPPPSSPTPTIPRTASPLHLTPSRSPARSPDRYQPFESDGEEEEEDVVVRTIPKQKSARKSTDDAKATTSWKDRWGLKRNGSTGATGASHNNKPMWKPTVDPTTGRTYYYHRKTRETTWAKPPDALILPLPAQKKKKKANKKKQTNADSEPKAKKAAPRSPKRGLVPMTRIASPKNGDVLMPHPRSKDSKKADPPLESDLEIDRMLSDLSPEAETLQKEGEKLLENLRNVVDDQPFDEPLLKTNSKKQVTVDEKSVANRTQAAGTIYSGFSSHKSRLSESTQPIKNTSRGVIQSMMAVPKKRPGVASDAQPRPQIPKNIPVPRLRELNVEEFSTSRRDLHLTDRSRLLGPHHSAMRARKENTVNTPASSAKQGALNSGGPDDRPLYRNHHHDGDDQHSDDGDDDCHYDDKDSYAGTDSISALSEDNLSYSERRELNYDDARRRALQRAIAQQDWDLAAQMAESLRRKPSRLTPLPPQKGEAQSEIDHYIARNDWTSVENYIQNARVVAHHTERKRMNQHLMKARPQKRFGARSQLQHTRNTGGSTDSFDSFGTGHSDYTPETPPGKQQSKGKHLQAPRAQARRPREFAC